MMNPDRKYDLRSLKKMIGDDEEAIKSFTSMFLSNSSQVMEELLKAFESKDFPALGGHAHKLKSSIDLMGIADLKEDIRTIETNAKQELNLHELSPLISKLKRIMRIASEQLERDIL